VAEQRKTVPFPGQGIQAVEIERQLLGSLLVNPDYIVQVAAITSAEDFYNLRHRLFYRALLALHGTGKPVERLHLIEWFKEHPDDLKQFGGADQVTLFWTETQNSVTTAQYALHYAHYVQYYARRRLIVKRAHEIADAVNSGEMEHAAALSMLEQTARDAQLASLAQDDLVSILDAVREQMDARDQPETDPVIRFSSGLTGLDNLLGGGFRKNEMYIHGGRPGMGKTSAGLKYGLEAARQMHDDGLEEMVVIITLEMSVRELTNRLLSSLSGVEYTKLDRQDELTAVEYQDLYRAVAQLADLKHHLYFWNPSSVQPEEIWRKLQQVQVEMGRDVGTVIVDHMHIMSAPDKQAGDERIKYNYIIDMFRHMRDHRDEITQTYTVNAAWHILGQLSRKCESRRDKRPILSDFRETGKIEEHANAIIMYYRDSMYNADIEPDDPEYRGMEIIIRKNRGGPTGTATVMFYGETYAIENAAYAHEVDEVEPPPPIDPTLL